MAIVYGCSTSTEVPCLLAFQLILAVSIIQVHGVTPPGFTNIDCGFIDGESYTDSITKLSYVSDREFVEGGMYHGVVPKLMTGSTDEQQKTLRSFSEGLRNCYTLPSTRGKKYVLRATFTYGNYDGLNKTYDGSLFLFGLHIGANFWTTMNLTNTGDPSNTYWKEVIAVAPDDFISVCLVNFETGVPFVSSLEMRRLDDRMYPFVNSSVSVSYFSRLRFGLGPADDYITRYPIDTFDRFWEAFTNYSYPWLNMSTSEQLNILPGNDDCQVPSAILQKASTINSSFSWLNISVRTNGNLDAKSLELLPIFHFAELDNSSANRWFDIYSDGVRLFANYSPPQHRVDSTYHPGQFLRNARTTFSLRKVAGSVLPPLINAFEVYSLVRMDNLTTNSSDVSSITSVKKQYSVTPINWNGDPCSPREYTWEGVRCNYYDGNQNPRIILVNLSARGLSGVLTLSFRNMLSLEMLDLSHNNLSGTIPDYQLNSLKSLNLSYNQLRGPMPDYLFRRYKAGSLDLRLEGNPLCSNVSESYCIITTEKKDTTTLLIAVIVPVVAILVVLLILWRLYCKGKSKDHDNYDMYEEETPLHIDIRRFRYAELKTVTNNFQSIIGKGGFGTVYHGILENGEEVAVKVLVETSLAQSKDFLPEVQTLSKVHHKNLVALVGYCQNMKCLALIYDFMPGGNLQQLLRGGQDYSLSWEERLHIALDAAQGLDYLHESCTPAIVHRDVKTANILLDENLVAKISDFGLSRALTAAHTHISTVAAGTLGYLDPEYHATFQLTMKADVYSFGIVLLEIITGQPSVLLDPQPVHLPNWVRQKIANGSIHDVVDKRLSDQYDATSLQSAIDLAMNCLENASIHRPAMTEVVSRLKVCLPTVSSEKQLVSPSPRQKNVMDANIRRQFQLMISGVSTISNEGSSFQSGIPVGYQK